MKVVVTGATGLIGSRLIATLQTTHEVHAVAKRPPVASPHAKVSWLSIDLTSPSFPELLPASADVAVHLAQSPHYHDFPQQALDVFDVNVGSTARLLDWGRRAGVQQFILASSGAVASTIGPPSYYAAAKRSAEMLSDCYATVFRVFVPRFFFVYGAGQRPGMLVPRLIDRIRSGDAVPVAPPDGPRMNPIHVSDAVRALTLAIERQVSGGFDIAGPEVLSVREMAVRIAQRLGTTVRFRGEADQAAADVIGDISAMTTALAAPECSFSQGLAELIPAMTRA